MGLTADSTRDWRESLGRTEPGIRLVTSKLRCHALSRMDTLTVIAAVGTGHVK